MMFRLIVYAAQRACIRGISEPGDFVSVAQLGRLLRQRGFDNQIVENTRARQQQAAEFAATASSFVLFTSQQPGYHESAPDCQGK